MRSAILVRPPRAILALWVDPRRRNHVSGYLPVFIFAVLIVAFGVVSLVVAGWLRPGRPDAVKLANYECGAEPIGSAWIQFPVGFYLVALVFIVFDALAVFLFPWADRKSTRLNSSHELISYAVFCLKKKKYMLNH